MRYRREAWSSPIRPKRVPIARPYVEPRPPQTTPRRRMSDRLKKLLMGVAALAALAAGGSAIANAAQGGSSTATPAATQQSQTADTPEPGDKPDANEQGETNDGNGQGEKADQVTGADAQKAKDAALAATGGGKVNEVSAEHQDGETNDDNGKADTPEPGDTADPAYESRIAYD